MRRLRSDLLALVAEANYRGLHLLSLLTSIDVEDPEPDSGQEAESKELSELQARIRAVRAQVWSLRTPLQMRPLEVPDETHVVPHVGSYSVTTSGISPAASYVNRNPADELTPKSTTTHTEVTYHIVDVLVPMGFARDGTPLTRRGMDVMRIEREVPDN